MNPLLYRFLSNTGDPSAPYAEMYLIHDYHSWLNGPESMQDDWFHHLDWINAHVVGQPKETSHYTSEQLRKEGYIGVYTPRIQWLHKFLQWLSFPDWSIDKIQEPPKSPKEVYRNGRVVKRHSWYR